MHNVIHVDEMAGRFPRYAVRVEAQMVEGLDLTSEPWVQKRPIDWLVREAILSGTYEPLLVWIITLLARVSELERELKKAESWWERASQPRERL